MNPAQLEDEQLDAALMAPGVPGLRRERERALGSLLEYRDERAVRDLLADCNRRIKEDRLRPALDLPRAIIAPDVDVDAMVAG